MPELPEVQTIASELNRKLKGKSIKKVIVNAAKVVAVGSLTLSPKRVTADGVVEKFKKLLAGQKFLSVRRRAKLLIFDLSPTSPRLRRASGPLSILAHLKMTGQFIFEDKKLRAKTGGKYRLLNRLTASLEKLPSKH